MRSVGENTRREVRASDSNSKFPNVQWESSHHLSIPFGVCAYNSAYANDLTSASPIPVALHPPYWKVGFGSRQVCHRHPLAGDARIRDDTTIVIRFNPSISQELAVTSYLAWVHLQAITAAAAATVDANTINLPLIKPMQN